VGGSSFNQTQNKIGNETPTIKMLLFFKAFNIQDLIKEKKITAGHTILGGGFNHALLEMCFSSVNLR
jgi:phosphoribosylformylglycinamidine synthase